MYGCVIRNIRISSSSIWYSCIVPSRKIIIVTRIRRGTTIEIVHNNNSIVVQDQCKNRKMTTSLLSSSSSSTTPSSTSCSSSSSNSTETLQKDVSQQQVSIIPGQQEHYHHHHQQHHINNNNETVTTTTTSMLLQPNDSTQQHLHGLMDNNVALQGAGIVPLPPPPKIYILGAGSIGLLLSSMIKCTFPSYPIQLLLRPSSSILLLLSLTKQQQNEQHEQEEFNTNDTTKRKRKRRKKNEIHVCLQQAFQHENIQQQQEQVQQQYPTKRSGTNSTTTTTTTITRLVGRSARTSQPEQDNIEVSSSNRTTNHSSSRPLSLSLRSSSPPRIVPISYEIILPSTPFNTTNTLSSLQEQWNRNRMIQQQQQSCNYIFVTTKAYHALDAIQSLYHSSSHQHLLVGPNQTHHNHEQQQQQHRKHYPSSITKIIVFCNGTMAIVQQIKDYIATIKLQQQQQQQQQQEAEGIDPTNPSCISSPIIQVYSAITTHGVYRPSSSASASSLATETNVETSSVEDMCHIVHAGYGNIVLESDCQDVATILQFSNLNCTTTSMSTSTTDSNTNDNPDMEDSSIQSLLWYKLATNCIINPLTTIYNCTNGELVTKVNDFHTLYLYPILHEIATLYAAIMKTKNVNAPTITSTVALSEEQQQEKIEFIYNKMVQYVLSVIQNTAMNYSSTYQDVYHHNTKSNDNGTIQTEIPYMNGYVIEQCQLYSIACPYNMQLYQQFNDTIQQMQNRRQSNNR